MYACGRLLQEFLCHGPPVVVECFDRDGVGHVAERPCLRIRTDIELASGAEDLPERDGHVEVPIPCECDEVVELRLRAEQIEDVGFEY